MADDPTSEIRVIIGRDGEGEIDLHGYHPRDDDVSGVIKGGIVQAFEMRLSKLRIIHGHGRNRPNFVRGFVNSNTGWLGQTVRQILRSETELRQWMLVKFDCTHDGSTLVRLRRPKAQ